MLGFLSIKTIFCQIFLRFRCKAKISSSGDKEVEESKLAAAAAVALEKRSVFGNGAGETDAPWRVSDVVVVGGGGGGVVILWLWRWKERRNEKKMSECCSEE
jgi:hypothetical protein